MQKKTISLSNVEMFQLSQEVNAFFGEKISVYAKYKATELSEKVSAMLKPYIDTRNKEIKELAPDGNIPQFLFENDVRISNPVWEEYTEIMKPLDEEKQEITCTLMDITLIRNLETQNNYPIFYKFFYDASEDKKD